MGGLHFGGPVIHPPAAIGWLLAALVALNFAVFLPLPGYLRDNYPDVWESLRSPEVFGGPPGSRMLLLGFVWSSRITRMNDLRLRISAWTARFAVIAFTTVVAWQYWIEYH